MSSLLTGFTFILWMSVAQDPMIQLPGSYSLQFENEWVRVVRVHYEPYAKLPVHAHNALPAAYVYLNDGGPVLFRHVGTSYGPATRPATKTGSFRIYRGLEEVHEVENTSALPSDFLRVEFKTEPVDVKTLKGRFARETAPVGENLHRVQFENDQIRISRVICAPGRSTQLVTGSSEPSLVVAVEATQVRWSGETSAIRAGQERWIRPGTTVTVDNISSAPSEFLRFDFKTRPVTSTAQR